ncbi:TORTIFOLIA1-like protein 3 [Silene latifolia]|uniref:TORTIFOLIA1-like protein 3 n=1 Tax=Silene latifolia TaxID=37657 RepID=UPI003D7894F5
MAPKQNAAGLARDLRHRILSCMTKLSDKDTHSHAVSELQSIIPTLTADTFSLFINSLSSISSSDRASVRSASLTLLSSLSSFHGSSLSAHLPKLTAAVLRRLRDHDTAVRSAAAGAVSVFCRHSLSSTSAFNSLVRAFGDALATEQEVSAQGAAAMCVAAAVESSPVVDAVVILKLVPKWMKLLRSDGFKAKSAVLVLLRSVIRACKIGNCDLLRDLVNCVVEFLKSEDWASRKASAEVLTEIAVVERELLSEMKSSCLRLFESRKFDKVKGVREAMVQMVEAWKEVPDVFDDGSPPPNSQTSSRENASNARFPARSKISCTVGLNTPEMRKKQASHRRLSICDSALKTTARNRGVPDVTRRRSSTPVYSKKPSERTADVTDLRGSSVTPNHDDDSVVRREDVKSSKPETKRGLFSKNSSSRVMPYAEDDSNGSLAIDNSLADICRHQKDSDHLSLIRKQLVQIEHQQSSLMDILQKFIGSSQDGMRTLETRVHGLEQALDDISYDLAVSTARMSNVEPPRSSCCLLPGSDFLSSKFWRRPGAHWSTSRFSFSAGTPSVSAINGMTHRSPGNGIGLENRRFRLRGPGGIIMNPLAEIHGDPRGISEASSSRVWRSVRAAA